MLRRRRQWLRVAFVGLWVTMSTSRSLVAQPQSQPLRPSPKVSSTAASEALDQEALVATHEQLISILRASPRLIRVLEQDPSLLGDQEYISRNNPELGEFLQKHPEIARNPEFYLFEFGRKEFKRGLQFRNGERPEFEVGRSDGNTMRMLSVLLFFACTLGALLWIVRVLLENRSWARIIKIQTELYNKMLDKFSTSEQLLAYLGSEAGKRFFESAPIPASFDPKSHIGIPLGRVLVPLQFGMVMTLVGVGFFYLRSRLEDAATPLLVLGTIALTLGIGFIISAGLSWALARHFGLLPQTASVHGSRVNSDTND